MTQVCGKIGHDVIEGLGHRREGIVGSEDDVVAAEDLNCCVQRLTVICQRVAPQRAGQAARQIGGVGGGAGDDRPLVEPADHRRQPAAAVRQADSHFGSTRERAAGDQRRPGQCGLDGHPGAEAKSHLGHPGRQVLVTGMDQDQGIKFVRDREESVQARVGQLGTADLCADLDTEESRMAHAPAHLVDGPVGVLQGDGAQRSEAGRVLVDDPGEELVLSRRQFDRAGGRRLVAERHWNRRKNLHGNTFTIHIDEPGIR